MKTMHWAIALLSLLCLRPAAAQDQISFNDSAIDEIIATRVGPEGNKSIMGLGLAVVHNGKIVYLRGYGFEDFENEVKVDPMKTRFRWASISKTLTAATAVIADSTGQVELDKDISLYYPTYKPPMFRMAGSDEVGLVFIPRSERSITMRMLLSHTSGIQHYANGYSVPVPPPFLADSEFHNTGMEWALQYWVSAPLRFTPGTGHSYSTFAYNLAGVVLEKRAGIPFEGLVQALVGDPAGMSTLRADTLWDPAPRRAVGYHRGLDGEWVREGDNDVSWKLAGGGFISTVQDMGNYAGALLRGDILTDSELETLFEQQELNNGTPANNGRRLLGWAQNGSLISHGGAQAKGQCALSLRRSVNNGVDNSDTLAIAIMTNAGLVGMVDLEADGFISDSSVNLWSIESSIRDLVEGRLRDGQPPIDIPDRNIMRAERNVLIRPAPSHLQMTVTSQSKSAEKMTVKRK